MVLTFVLSQCFIVKLLTKPTLLRFYFKLSLFFYILGAFLIKQIKQLFNSRLLHMRLVIANSAGSYLPSHIQRALME